MQRAVTQVKSEVSIRNDHRSSLNLICLTLTTFTCLFTAIPPQLRNSDHWDTFNAISNTVQIFRTQIPPIDDPSGLQPPETVGRANPEIAHAHMELLAAFILLSNSVLIVPQYDGAAQALEAASSMATLVKRVRGDSPLPQIHAPISLLVR
jgi:hypothetical protein